MVAKAGPPRPHEERPNYVRRGPQSPSPGEPSLGDSFLIVTEGEVTERLYFESVRADAPCPITSEELKIRKPNEEQLKRLFIEFEFDSIGRRLFGEDFKTGRGFDTPAPDLKPAQLVVEGLLLISESEEIAPAAEPPVTGNFKTIADIPHECHLLTERKQRGIDPDLARVEVVLFRHGNQQSGRAAGAAPWEELVVRLCHLPAALGLILSLTLLIAGFLKHHEPGQ